VAGGDTRTVDYEVYEPAYLMEGARPSNVVLEDASGGVLTNPVLSRGQRIRVIATLEEMSLGTFLSQVVLMAPGATTHHSDMSQRYHQLPIVAGGQALKVEVDMPLTDKDLPSGFYMLFVVTNTGISSEAVWIQLQ